MTLGRPTHPTRNNTNSRIRNRRADPQRQILHPERTAAAKES